MTSSQLISESSLALRDTLAQALVVAQSQTLASDATAAESELAFNQVGVAIGAVTLALSVRAEVATVLESDEINAARIQTQFAAAAGFLSGAVQFLRNTIKADYSYNSATNTLQVELIGPQSIIDRMNDAEPGFTIPTSIATNAEIFIDSTQYDQATWANADWGTQAALPYGPTYKLDPNASTQFLTDIVVIGGPRSISRKHKFTRLLEPSTRSTLKTTFLAPRASARAARFWTIWPDFTARRPTGWKRYFCHASEWTIPECLMVRREMTCWSVAQETMCSTGSATTTFCAGATATTP